MKVRRENDDIVLMYLESIKDIKPLEADEEADLIIKAQKGDIEARNKVINANLKFVVKCVKRFTNSNIPILDLIEEGNSGLIDAIEHFDFNANCKFTTYAVWWINQAVIKYFQDKSRLIRIPVNKVNDLAKINERIDEYNERNKAIDYEQIADELGLDVGAVVNLVKVSCPAVSFDKIVEDDDENNGASIKDLIVADLPSAEEMLEEEDERNRISKVIDTLPERERNIIRLRYGFSNFGEMGLEDIGQIMNLTKERVRQLESEALNKLREKLA